MRKISFVIGATATGKPHFIEHHFSDENSVVLNIYDLYLLNISVRKQAGVLVNY